MWLWSHNCYLHGSGLPEVQSFILFWLCGPSLGLVSKMHARIVSPGPWRQCVSCVSLESRNQPLLWILLLSWKLLLNTVGKSEFRPNTMGPSIGYEVEERIMGYNVSSWPEAGCNSNLSHMSSVRSESLHGAKGFHMVASFFWWTVRTLITEILDEGPWI